MTTALAVRADASSLDAVIRTLVEDATRLASAARAGATHRAYKSDWAHFEVWCDTHGFAALPALPTTVGFYLTAHAYTLVVATLVRRLSAIAISHRSAGFAYDGKAAAIRDVIGGIKRTRGTAQKHADALTTGMIKQLVATCAPDRLIDVRDRAVLLVGFAGAFRRSELAALAVEDIAISADGLRITIRRSKADQDGAGQIIAIGRTGNATCPVAAYETWLIAADVSSGRAFRSISRHGHVGTQLAPLGISETVKKRARLAGLDITQVSGHSLRAGLATAAAQAGVEERLIMQQTRHTGASMVRRYIRDGQLFRRNLAAEIGL